MLHQGIANVFKIRHGKETHVFRTENTADKKALLVQLRQVAEELAAKKRKEREGEHERRKTQFQAGGGGDVGLTKYQICAYIDIIPFSEMCLLCQSGLRTLQNEPAICLVWGLMQRKRQKGIHDGQAIGRIN